MAEENNQIPPRLIFGWWKWPGYATAGLGIIRLFHLSEDIDFALNVLRSLGGNLGMIASIVASPFFGIAMVAYGVLHLIFVGEPKATVRHPLAPIIGWSVFGICLVTIVSVIGYGYFGQCHA